MSVKIKCQMKNLKTEMIIKERRSRKVSDLYFEEPPVKELGINFTDMNISRPILKAVTSLGYVTPTPIQARTVPVALMGKNICACAATGTGKTAAFFLPILEHLLFHLTHTRVTRILILTPTRELVAMQVHSVGKALAKHMDVSFSLVTSGLDSKSQEDTLRKNPNVVIATPEHLVDHLHNAPFFNLATIEILVLDEEDRMLEEHFEDQMNEIIKLCPVKRQTMLFSVTMIDKVEEFARLSLNYPVRLFVDKNTDVAGNLRQEFVRIKSKREGNREAIVTG